MAHVYDREPDGRQMTNQETAQRPIESAGPAPSRFRPRYRALSETEKLQHDLLKDAYASLESQIMRLSDGRYRSLALTALEESCMWAVKELTA